MSCLPPCLALPGDLIPSGFPANIDRCTLFPNTYYKLHLCYLRCLDYPKIFGEYFKLLNSSIFYFSTASRTALRPTQPPIQWVPGILSLGVKRPGREADHSPPSSAEVNEWVELYLHSPYTPLWRGAQLSTGTTLPFTFTFWYLLSISSIYSNQHFVFHSSSTCLTSLERQNKFLMRTKP
jgi:hypothetical protein